MSWKSWVRSHPLKASLLVLILVVASSVVAYAYFSTLPAKSGPQASIESQPLKLTIRLDKTSFQQGENITINISVENVSNETIKITFPESFGYLDDQNKWHQVYFDFVIVDENDTEIWRWSYPKLAAQMIYDVVLGAGEKLTNILVWNQNIYRGFDVFQIPAGTYHVRAAMPAGESSIDIDGGSKGVSLETPSIMFTVG